MKSFEVQEVQELKVIELSTIFLVLCKKTKPGSFVHRKKQESRHLK